MPCGSGRHSLELARRGHSVTGHDLSAEAIGMAAIHHVYTVARIVDLLSGNGFAEFELFGGPGGDPYRLGSGRLLLTARRTS